jgi:hypothetical protein
MDMIAVHAEILEAGKAPAYDSVGAVEAQGEMCLTYINHLEEKVAMLSKMLCDQGSDARRRLAELEGELSAVKDNLALAQVLVQDQAQELTQERHEHEKTKLLAAKQEELDRIELGYLSSMHEALERQLAELQDKLIREVERRAKSDALAQVAEDALDLQLYANLAADGEQHESCNALQKVQKEHYWGQMNHEYWAMKEQLQLLKSENASLRSGAKTKTQQMIAIETLQEEANVECLYAPLAGNEYTATPSKSPGECDGANHLQHDSFECARTKGFNLTGEAVLLWVAEKEKLLAQVQSEKMSVKLEKRGLASDKAAMQEAREKLAEVARAITCTLQLILQDAIDSVAQSEAERSSKQMQIASLQNQLAACQEALHATQERFAVDMRAIRTALGDRDTQVQELENLLKSERDEAGAYAHELDLLNANKTREIESRDCRIKERDAEVVRLRELVLQQQEPNHAQAGVMHSPLWVAHVGQSSKSSGTETRGIITAALGHLDHVATPPPTPYVDSEKERGRALDAMLDVTLLRKSGMSDITLMPTRGVSALWSEDGKRNPSSTITLGDSSRREQTRLYRGLPRSRSADRSLSPTPSPTTSVSSPEMSPLSLSPRRPFRQQGSLLLSRMSRVSPFAIRNRGDRINTEEETRDPRRGSFSEGSGGVGSK